MLYAIKKRGFLQIFGSVGVSTLNRIDTHQHGSHNVYTTVQNNVVGEMKFLDKRVKNVVVPHGNLSSPNGNVLLSNSVGGSCKVTGAFNIFYFRGKSLLFPSENNVLLPSGVSLSLPPVFLGTKKAGIHSIYLSGTKSENGTFKIYVAFSQKQWGSHLIKTTVLKKERGTHCIYFTTQKRDSGLHRIQNTFTNISTGTNSIQSSVFSSLQGAYNTFFLRGGMLLFQSGNSALLPNGDSLALPPNSIVRAERGTQKIRNFFEQAERGFHRIYSSISRGQLGQHIVKAYVSNSFRGTHKISNALASLKQQGFFRLYLSAIQKQWGASFIKGTVSSRVSGKHSVYAPLSRRETGEFQIIKGLPIYVVGGYRTFGRASKEEQGTHSIYASSLDRSAQGNFNLFYTRGYKLNFPSGNTIQLPGGDYLALQGDAVSSSQMGAHRTYVSVRVRKVGNLRLYKEYRKGQIGTFNVFYFRGRSLFFPSANAIVLPQGDYLALPSEVMTDTKSGAHRVYNLKLRRPLGSFKLYNKCGEEQLGEYKVYRALLSAQTGTYVVESISTFSKLGTYNIRQDNALQLESGYWLRKDLGIKKQGRYRVENADKVGYLIYIGYGSMPDLTGPADAFASVLPASVSVNPPESGETEIFVVIRSRNSFNLVSQNQKPMNLLLDSNGDEVLGPLTTPSEVGISCIMDDGFLVTARYEGYFNDRNKANRWEVYLKAEESPIVGLDVPAATGVIKGAEMQSTIGPYESTGLTYYLIVAVRRTADNTVATIASEIFVPAAPAMPLGL